MNKSLILVCNDDGVFAPGIAALIEVAQEFGKVVVVAPDKPQSGSGHGITISATLRINKIQEEENISIYSTTGTPVDCIKLAVNEIMHRKPDILISGINHGSNASINVIYSGTMSAAIEGAMEGIPSVGFSLLDHSIDADFSASQELARRIIPKILEKGLPKGVCLNVNIPKLQYEEIKGIRVCHQANGNWVEEFDARKDPSGHDYYWMTGRFVNFEENSENDIALLENSYVAVVPVQFDMTAYSAMEEINSFDL